MLLPIRASFHMLGSSDILDSSGFDSEGEIKSRIFYVHFGKSTKYSSKFHFEVKRVGSDPMVEMEICDDRSQWGLDCRRLEVTNSGVKVIGKWGY